MKKSLITTIIILAASALIGGVPLKWTVETSKVQPVQFEVVHGESIDLAAVLQSYGKPLDLTGETAHLYWQTNGMEQAWWAQVASVTSNRITATFAPEMDPGAASVVGFLGIEGENYRAAFQLRFRHGPGATVNEIEPPVRTLDFARVVVTNAPWATPEDVADEAEARADADATLGAAIAQKADQSEISSLSNRVEQLTGGAVTEDDVRSIVTPELNRKADAEFPSAVGDLSFGGGVTFAFELAYTNGVATSVSGRFTLPGGGMSNIMDIDIGEAVANGVEVRRAYISEMGDAYELRIYRVSGTDNVRIDAVFDMDVVDSETCGIHVTALSVIESIERHAVPVTRKVNGQPLSSDIDIEGMSAKAIELKDGTLKTHDNATTITASTVGAVPDDSSYSQLRSNASSALAYSSGIYRYMIGNTNAWFEGTNYNVNAEQAAGKVRYVPEPWENVLYTPPSLQLYEIRDGARKCVWDQRDWTVYYWQFKAAQLSNSFERVTHTLETNKMTRGWAKYTAVNGIDNPAADTLWIDTPKITIAAGMQWQKMVETGGTAYYTITGNGITLGPEITEEGAFLTFKDFEGNAVLTLRKTSSQLVYCECGTDIVAPTYMDAQGRIVFHFTTSVQPTGEFSATLEDAEFIEEGEADCPANVTWTGSSGSYDCHFLAKDPEASACFARFKILQEGENVVEYSIPIKINDGIIFEQNGVTHKIRPSVSGSTVTWSVVQ